MDPSAGEIWTIEARGGPSASDGALGSDAVDGLGCQHGIDHRIVDRVVGTGPLRALGIASVGVGGSSGGTLLTSLFFGHAGQLGLGGLLVTFSEALVPLALRIVDHPVASLARIGDRPGNLTECLVQR